MAEGNGGTNPDIREALAAGDGATGSDRTCGSTMELDLAIAEYLEALDSGRAPLPERFAAAHPNCAEGLRRFFADRAALADRLARGSPQDDAITTIARPYPANADADLKIRPIEDLDFRRYELSDELGRGGMGVVYRARDCRLDREVALKVIRASQYNTNVNVQWFLAEAANAARLVHPNIVPVYEVGWLEGHPYFTMQIVEGGSLADSIDRLGGQRQASARLVAVVARAVQHAHDRGILHRDLKPANILLDSDGRPMVADFGLALRRNQSAEAETDARDRWTSASEGAGSPRYMSPEQANGKSDLTVATDIYGLGTILYELLAGRPAFVAEGVTATLRQVPEVRPEPPLKVRQPARSRSERGDDDLEAICLRCLEKNPSLRYQSASALADDLDRYLRDEPVDANPPSRVSRVRRYVRRHRSLLFATTAIVLALTVGLATAMTGLRRAQESAREADLERQKAELIGSVLQEVSPTPGHEIHSVDVMRVERKFLERSISHLPEVEAPVRTALAAAYESIGARADAIRNRQRVVAILRDQSHGSTADIARAEAELASTLRGNGQQADAEELETRAWERLKAAGFTSISKGGPDRLMIASRFAQVDNAVSASAKPDAFLFAERGVLRARAGQFADAAKDHEEAAKIDPTYHWWRFYAAMLRIKLEDRSTYDSHCTQLIEQLKTTTKDAWAVERTAKLYFAVSRSPADAASMKSVLAALNSAIATSSAGESKQATGWLLIARGMGRYRNDSFKAAADDLVAGRDALKIQVGGSQAAAIAAVEFHLSMARYRNREESLAIQAFNRGMAIMPLDVPLGSADDLGDGIENWILAQLARDEARLVLFPSPAHKP